MSNLRLYIIACMVFSVANASLTDESWAADIGKPTASHGVARHIQPRNVSPRTDDGLESLTGLASYYSRDQQKASGGTFDPSEYTCAHRSLPFGTQLRVADPGSGRSVVVTVNDRGPFTRGRILDLSLAAARALGMIRKGVMRVEAQVIS
jgi:rare lipoprotein A